MTHEEMSVVALLVLVLAVAVHALWRELWLLRKPAPKPAPKIVYQHRLEVHYKNGKIESWFFERDENLGPVALWKHFVRWWYCDKEKPYFGLSVPGRHIMLTRENIVRFDLRVLTAEENA